MIWEITTREVEIGNIRNCAGPLAFRGASLSSKTVRPPSSLEIARSWLNAAANSAKGSNLLSTARVKRSSRRNPECPSIPLTHPSLKPEMDRLAVTGIPTRLRR